MLDPINVPLRRHLLIPPFKRPRRRLILRDRREVLQPVHGLRPLRRRCLESTQRTSFHRFAACIQALAWDMAAIFAASKSVGAPVVFA